MTFSFDSGVAEKVGIHGAIIFNCFCFWLSLNENEGRNQHAGRTWTFNSVSGLAETFTFLSKDQIRRAIDRLVEAGFLEVGRFNRLGFDRTRWYTIGPEGKGFVPNPSGKGADPIPVKTTYIDPINTKDEERASAPPAPAQVTKTKSKEKGVTRRKHGFYGRVLLSDSDMESLRRDFPTDLEDRIERVDSYCEATGKRYSNYAATIRNWARRDREKGVEVYGSTSADPRPDLPGRIPSVLDGLFDDA